MFKIERKKKIIYSNSLEGLSQYFTRISCYKSKDDNGNTEYDADNYYARKTGEINFMNPESALYSYLTEKNKKRNSDRLTIYPFGLNESQILAIQEGFSNQISVIQGPPGTGKTQTILNIVANAIMNEETVAVVSPNNAATRNVYGKLAKNDFSFFVAELGNKGNRKKFFEKDIELPPNLNLWNIDEDKVFRIEEILKRDIDNLKKLLETKNRLADLKQRLREWRQEKKYFDNYFSSDELNNLNKENKLKRFVKISFSEKKQIELLTEMTFLNAEQISFLKKVKYFFKYGIYKFDSFETDEKMQELLLYLEKDYYKNKISETENEIKKIELFLSNNNYEELLKNVQENSKILFKAKLAKKYLAMKTNDYSINNFKTNYMNFCNEFPVTLSTCDAITDCIAKGFLFDYVIIDEASMGSIVPSIFPFSVAKNIIVVGDQKQLKHITFSEQDMNEILEVDSKYDYFKQNILSSLELIYKDNLPVTLLKEHYRCHPMIINFCNKEFYNDELLIMTEASKDSKPLILVETSDGNHMKFDFDKKVFNQREIDSALSDELKSLVPEINELKTLGYATPFRRQADKAADTIRKKKKSIEADTVHKFQGRECEGIFFSTVLDNKGSKRNYDFVETDSLINVAVSRAEKLFVLNSSVKEFKRRSKTVASLIRYIEYYGDYSLQSKSSVRSIFDLLTTDFKNELKEKELNFRRKHSKYASENLMMDLIDDVLEEEEFNQFVCMPEYEIRKLARDFSVLLPEEKKYVENGARLDFVFYYKTGKEPIAAIEVDGHKYHCMPKQKEKDDRKDSIVKKLGLKIKRFSTNGSEEEKELRRFLTELLLNINSTDN